MFSLFFVIVAFFFVGGWEKLHRMIFPIKTEYGINHNPEREKLHIPLIKNEWKEVPAMGTQFRKWYTSFEEFGHTKKMIEFGYFGALKEHDFFEDTITNEVFFITHDYDLNEKKYLRLRGGKHGALFIDNGEVISKKDFEEKTKNINK